MVQETVESKVCEYDIGNAETNFPNCNKQLPVAAKKTALRDLQNENRFMVSNHVDNSPFTKDRGPNFDASRVSGIKRPSPECLFSLHHQQSASNGNGHLVYVRRKSEADMGKSSVSENANFNAQSPRSISHGEETSQPKPQIKEPKVSCFSAFAPFPMASSASTSSKPTVPLSLGHSTMRFAPAESNYLTSPAVHTIGNPKVLKNLNWEERYHHLQVLLRTLDQSDQEEYVQMLRSLSSVELSRHAVELEKRSIQLSLEEAKELQRVRVFNVLGKSVNLKAPADLQDCLDK